jgi:exopolyphosphatase/guanosine-5'-triphosphate,3'-diphosphate pyrophosphatase
MTYGPIPDLRSDTLPISSPSRVDAESLRSLDGVLGFGRSRRDRRIAVCDLGSNSFRLVVFDAAGEYWRRTDEIYQPVRIAAGLAATGKLSPEGIERALATIDVFHHFCQASGVDEIDAVATSAIRDASNRDELIERSPLPIRVLSREQEGYHGYLAAVNSTTLKNGAVLDLGGGSMQLISVAERIDQRTESWPLGALRMTEQFGLGEGPATKEQLQELRAYVAEELGDVGWLKKSGDHLVGIGGTVRNLATAAQRAASAPAFGVQGFVLRKEALSELIEKFAAMPATERGKVPGIKPARADLILAGAVVVESVLELCHFKSLEVTEAGLREGVFFARQIERDPPLFDDVRKTSVRNLAALYPVEPDGHVAHVSQLALGLFDELAAANVHGGDKRERELLWAACQLHDIGMTVAYDDHHKHSRYLILNAGLPGFSPREVALIAQAVRYHRKGMPGAGPFSKLMGKGDDQRLLRMATLLRLAEDFERSRDGTVTSTAVTVDNGAVTLDLLSVDDARVPRWAAGRELELFKRAFDRELILTSK